jgi:redox-sensitive bicupin YhaK (pirin superfamily)
MNAAVQLDAVQVERKARAVEHVANSQVAPVGTFTVRRALPFRERHSVGPWVFLDHFGPMRVKPGDDGVGAHPHAGIETVTYLLAGRNEHRDSAGHTGIVTAGGAQWMTSGRGIVHAERPLAENEAELTMHGIQLWTSLPRALKTMEPRYQRIGAESIPTLRLDGATVRVIAGALAGSEGPAATLMPTFLWHATIEAGKTFEAPVAPGHEVAVYVIEGEARCGDTAAAAGRLAVFAGTEGLVRIANPGPAKLEVMVLGGAPAEGPLVFHGPFVMNSVEQVRAAEIAYRSGRMGTIE